MLMKPEDGVTTIGKGVTIKGDVSGGEDLTLDGTVEGTINLPDNSLTIGPNGRVNAEVRAQNVIVFGRIEGTLRVSERVDLRRSAIVKGDIYAGRLAIEENAEIHSKVELKGAESEERSPESNSSPKEKTLFTLESKT
jgi:cytoskeletal protein CcmA (bactofilin family)